MTDAEMVKAMEICKDEEIPCDDCPLVECGDCEGISRQYFYDRFNELKVENAALRERLDKAVKDVAERIENALFCEFADDMTFKMASRIEEVIKAELKGRKE